MSSFHGWSPHWASDRTVKLSHLFNTFFGKQYVIPTATLTPDELFARAAGAVRARACSECQRILPIERSIEAERIVASVFNAEEARRARARYEGQR